MIETQLLIAPVAAKEKDPVPGADNDDFIDVGGAEADNATSGMPGLNNERLFNHH